MKIIILMSFLAFSALGIVAQPVKAETTYVAQGTTISATLDVIDSERLRKQIMQTRLVLPCNVFSMDCSGASCVLSQDTGPCFDDLTIKQLYRDDGKILELLVSDTWGKNISVALNLVSDAGEVFFETTDKKLQMKCQTDGRQYGCLIWFLFGY